MFDIFFNSISLIIANHFNNRNEVTGKKWFAY